MSWHINKVAVCNKTLKLCKQARPLNDGKTEAFTSEAPHDGLPGPDRIALTTRWPLPDAVVGRLDVGVTASARDCRRGGDVGEDGSWRPWRPGESKARCLKESKGVDAAELREGARVEAEDTTLSPVSMPASRMVCHRRLFSCMAFAISSISKSHLF